MKIAILGVENSHADAFGELIKNNPELYGDIEVVGIYSEEEEAVKRIIDAGYATYAAASPDEFLGKVDGIIVTARHGDNHYKYAMPYVKAGVPCFIDKPFCANLENATELAKAAQDNGALLCGGSCLKFIDEIKSLARIVKTKKVKNGTIACPINMNNIYGGFWFYSQHLIEILTAVFGRNVKSVTAFCPDQSQNRITVIFNYGDFDVCGFYTDSYRYAVSLMTSDNNIYQTYCDDVTYTFKNEFDEFVNMVKSGVMPCTYDELVYPVKVLAAIERSYTEKKEIAVE
ncbi:MAG: Gfo/Idh/MocA family protein [Acutalibacteraceae bacterium]